MAKVLSESIQWPKHCPRAFDGQSIVQEQSKAAAWHATQHWPSVAFGARQLCAAPPSELLEFCHLALTRPTQGGVCIGARGQAASSLPRHRRCAGGRGIVEAYDGAALWGQRRGVALGGRLGSGCDGGPAGTAKQPELRSLRGGLGVWRCLSTVHACASRRGGCQGYV